MGEELSIYTQRAVVSIKTISQCCQRVENTMVGIAPCMGGGGGGTASLYSSLLREREGEGEGERAGAEGERERGREHNLFSSFGGWRNF